jgi:hypothetical protein
VNKVASKKISIRKLHRYLGFFLAAIMSVYALSGVVLIFRNTEIFMVKHAMDKVFEKNMNERSLGVALGIKRLKIEKHEGDIFSFKQGTYNSKTGEAKFTKMELPMVLGKMSNLHKADTNSPIFWLNIFFGLSLLFFSVSSFWMFLPKTKLFRRGMICALSGFTLALALLLM